MEVFSDHKTSLPTGKTSPGGGSRRPTEFVPMTGEAEASADECRKRLRSRTTLREQSFYSRQNLK